MWRPLEEVDAWDGMPREDRRSVREHVRRKRAISESDAREFASHIQRYWFNASNDI
jgi:hypothetical protein